MMSRMRRKISLWAPALLLGAFFILPTAGRAQGPDILSGEWRVNANNFHGRLEFSREGDELRGRAFFDNINHWEPLVHIRFNPERRWIEFDRPEAQQHFEGHLVRDDRMEGTFGGNLNWWAERAGGGGPGPGSGPGPGEYHEHSMIGGPWRINANNFRGKMEFTREGDEFHGRAFFENVNHWEPLVHVRFDPERRWIEFDRPEANQHFEGHLIRDDRMEGTFTGGFHWFAER